MDIYFYRFLTFFVLFSGLFVRNSDANCGCKTVRACYTNMLSDLKDQDEATCISDAVIGTSTVVIFLTAISQYCSNITEVVKDKMTYEGRRLYEVLIRNPVMDGKEDDRPIIFIDAGQEAGEESVGFALFIIEQLVACEDNDDMITKARWVILPSTNPDGQEFTRHNRRHWRKNTRPVDEGLSFGVDISRNFEGDWKSCQPITSGFSPIYPGPMAVSENETSFIQAVINKYKKDTKLYLSLRRNGHSLNFPHGYDVTFIPTRPQLETFAAQVTAKVNVRAGGVHLFTNQSIYELNGRPYCGHSVDYAHQISSIKYAYEMRVFLGSDSKIMMKFQTFPRGYSTTLRNGYYSGIREMYQQIIREHQYKQF